MKLTIGNQTIELLQPSLPDRPLTAPQAETYGVLMALARIGREFYEVEAVLRWLSLDSRLPLDSRLKHLQEKGFCRICEGQPV